MILRCTHDLLTTRCTFHTHTFAAAEPLLRELLQSRRKTLGDRHLDTLSSINDLGQLLLDGGDRAAAEPLFCEALNARRKTRPCPCPCG